MKIHPAGAETFHADRRTPDTQSDMTNLKSPLVFLGTRLKVWIKLRNIL